MKFLVPRNRVPLADMTIAAALLSAVATVHGQGAFNWQGGTGANPNDPTNAANYTGAVPTFNANNASGSFYTKNGSSTMTYTAAQGTTTFSGTGAASLTWIGWNNAGGVGETAAGSTVQVTGGTLNLNGTFANDGAPLAFGWVTAPPPPPALSLRSTAATSPWPTVR